MSLWDNITQKAAAVTDKAVHQAKNFTEQVKLRNQISEAQSTITDCYTQIGKQYAAAHSEDFDEAYAPMMAAIAGANRAVYTRSGQSGGALTGMGSTLCAAVISDGVALVANVGDSRCYLLRQGELIQVTEDHTAVAVLLRQGLLSPEEAAHHPDRHAITRAIGVEPEVQPDYTVIDLLRGDALLLCSDGLYNTLPPGELAGTLQELLQGGDFHRLIA